MSDDRTAQNPRLVAVEAELASDRGEIFDPSSLRAHEVHTLGRSENVQLLIMQAERKIQSPRRRSLMGMNLSFAWILRLFTFGRWKPHESPQRDYTYEFDPKTGGQRRIYVVEDRKHA